MNIRNLLAFCAILVIGYVTYTMEWSTMTTEDMNKLAIENMKKLVKQHTDAEMANNLNDVMATLVEDPLYEIYPARLKLEGKKNVSAFYSEHFQSFLPLVTKYELINEWWSPERACMEFDVVLEGHGEKPHRILVVITAKNNLLLGERFYISEELAQIFSGSAFSLWQKF